MKKTLLLPTIVMLAVVSVYFSSCLKCKCNNFHATIVDGGHTTELIVTSSSSSDKTYKWSTGATTMSIPYPAPGTYTCEVTGIQKTGDCQASCSYTATFTVPLAYCPPTVTDVDGNTYTTVRIGTKCWLKENLKTTSYRDGTAIGEEEDSTAWASIAADLTGAWCYYDGNAAYNTPYGKLYNWYAVSNTKGLCPVGWHVPTQSEFNELYISLGSYFKAGGKMKATTLWNAPNAGANDSSGFTAFPAGTRSHSGGFGGNLGNSTAFWTSTHGDMYYSLSTIDSVLYFGTSAIAGQGKSVRCIQN